MKRTWWDHLVGRNPRTSQRRRRMLLTNEQLETRCLLSDFRSITSFGNNIANPTFGEAGTDLLRLSPVAYADGISSPSLPQDPSARVISNVLNDQTDPNNPSQDLNTVNSNSLSAFGYLWGQFIDHDMDLTPDGGASFPIQVPPGDPIGGAGPLPFTRSQFDPNTGTSSSNPRQQINALTSFLDLSQVYGSTDAVADALRTHSGGLLKTSPGNELPFNNLTYFTQAQLDALNMANDSGAVPAQNLFATGDRRGNENLELTSLQLLFVRNHNRIANDLQALNPTWTDEQLYQEARKLNIAEEEIITYREYLPALLGAHALPRDLSYNATVNPSIATEFSTVAFRFGHSLLSGNIERHGNNGLGIADVNAGGASIALAQGFFDPTLINPNGITDPLTGHTSSDIDAILKGAADNNAQEFDLLVIRDVRNLLFGNGQFGGQDLIARDIQRARDHGIGSLNDVRAALGLPRYTSFAQITRDVAVQQKLQQLYGSIDNVDPFDGGLAETHVPGSNLGQTFTAILVNQFTRLARGDRFFYLNEHFTDQERDILKQGNTLAKVIEANTNIANLQSDVFIFTATISGTVFSDPDKDGGHRNASEGEFGLAGITVLLEDSSGNVLSTTTTDSHGHYRFDPQSGLSATGNYNVVIQVPSGFIQTTANPATIVISRGGFDVDRVDFGLAVNFTAPASSASAASLSGGAASALGFFPGGLLVSTNGGPASVVNVAMSQASTPVVQAPSAELAGPAPEAVATPDTSAGFTGSGNALSSSGTLLGVTWEEQHLARIMSPDALFPIL